MSVSSRLHLVILGADQKPTNFRVDKGSSRRDERCPNAETNCFKKTPNGIQIGPVRVPVANTYDVDNEYGYIMNKALRSYKQHRDKEKADNRQKLLKTAYRRRWHAPQRPTTPVANDRKARSKSILPPKMDAIREVGEANACSDDVEIEDSQEFKKPIDVKRVTLSMDTPAMPMSSSYHRRNQQTSQAWYSHSFPSASYLSNHMRMHSNASSTTPSPASSTTSGKSVTSATSKRPYSARTESSKNRPDSAGKYSYDGGIFLPNKPKHDYFVIHPDWVSEAMTIQKLSLNERRPVSGRTGTWPGRRCKSAPPPKFRNPITWDVQIENV